MSAQLDIETASPTSPRSPTSLIGHAADENSEDTNRGLISGHLRTGLGFTKKALGLGITLLLVGAVVLLALNYSATTEISEGNVLSSSKDHKPLKTASLHYIVNRLDKYTESHDLKELFGTLEDVTVTSPSGRMDKVKATESHLSADGKKLTLTAAGGSKAVIKKLTNGKVVVSIDDPNDKAWTPPKTKPGARRTAQAEKLCRKRATRKCAGRGPACYDRKYDVCMICETQGCDKVVAWSAQINGMQTGLTDNAMADVSAVITAFLAAIADSQMPPTPTLSGLGLDGSLADSAANHFANDNDVTPQVGRALSQFLTELLGEANGLAAGGDITVGNLAGACTELGRNDVISWTVSGRMGPP